MQTEVGGEWLPVMIEQLRGVNPRPYRYEYAADAGEMLDRLRSDLPGYRKRVQFVTPGAEKS